MNNKTQTPLEKLISDKARIGQLCREQEQKLNGHLSYLQEHAGSLLLSGMSSLLFPKTKPTDNNAQTVPEGTAKLPAPSFGLTDYLSVTKSILPLAWDIAQPFIMSWGIKKAKKWLIQAFTRKGK